MARTTEDLRKDLLAAAEEQLVGSPDGDVSTRAVCEAVGVTQPVLYRIFRDKQGLLDALAEVGLERYALRKAGLEVSADPVRDLLDGWDDHMAFAAENPALYRLMFSPRAGVDLAARTGVFALVRSALQRCAAIGRLGMQVDEAAALILSANVGLAFNRMNQPELYGSTATSHALRDAVFARVLLAADDGPAPSALPVTARQLAAQLEHGAGDLVEEEAALLQLWLRRIAGAA